MNWYRVIGTVLIVFISNGLFGQAAIPFLKSSYIVPFKLEVTHNKTTNLVFPSSIASIDRGSTDILVEKAVGVENILRVKADIKSFEETNLSVITNDGRLYSFLVNYNNSPAYLNISLDNSRLSTLQAISHNELAYSSSAMNHQNLEMLASRAADAKSNIHAVKDKSSKVSLELSGFYVKDDAMFCRLRFENNSMINYDIEQFRLYIRDKKQSKRTASQEIEIQPLYILGDTASVKGKAKQTLVIAVPKFTIPDDKFMFIEIMERNGGRHLALRVKNRHIVKASSL